MRYLRRDVWLLLAIVFLCFLRMQAQPSSAGTVDWHGIKGPDDEFAFLIPTGFRIFDEGEIYLGKESARARVKNLRVVARYVNGTVLMMQLLQGKTKEIQPAFEAMMSLDLLNERDFGGFRSRSYLKRFPDFVWEQQHFYNQERLYVVSAVYRNERNDIVDGFYRSVRLVEKGKVIAPNLPKDAKSTDLSAQLPPIKVEAAGSETVESKPDKPAVLVYRPSPGFKREFGKSNSGEVKVRLMLLPSGEVGKVELLSSPNVSLFDGIRNSAENLVFLPAVKNGKTVPMWKEVDYRFEMRLVGF